MGMRLFLTFHSSSFTQMRFNIGFTPGTVVQPVPRRRTPAINHAHPPFIENKRYRMKPRRIGDVVNRKAVSVYQTDAVLILIGGVPGRLETGRSGTRTVSRRNTPKYIHVQTHFCSAPSPRILPSLPTSSPVPDRT